MINQNSTLQNIVKLPEEDDADLSDILKIKFNN